ncbi:hypothetical protein SCWH03_52000 [Streptomyces pacificus]|uniref:Uncharacterized protein n=1 Tax=Streptomyces pacificus TaxID=2705029 RepID=A0A6A0B570_9ACTN|nr:hypothetical protein SCWH03_52000 [Streptomyces pacificus]
MDAEYPRDVDPSNTGQPHQVTGKVPDLMGNITRTLGNSADMPAAVPSGAAAALVGPRFRLSPSPRRLLGVIRRLLRPTCRLCRLCRVRPSTPAAPCTLGPARRRQAAPR